MGVSYLHQTGKDGVLVKSEKKNSRVEYYANYRAKNKDKIKAYYVKNKVKILANIQKYNQRPDIRVKRKAYMKTYSKVYRQNPKNRVLLKERQKVYDQTPKRKAYFKIYKQSQKSKAYFKVYVRSPKAKAYQEKWRSSLRGKLYAKNFVKAYRKTPKGKAVHTVSQNLRRANKKTGDLMAEQWLEVKYRSPICPMCGKFIECENLTQDHIIPLSHDGKHTKDNIQALCLSCNSSKHVKIPKQIVEAIA
jgi:5-methylcytosine-specific restriction endonuclease McrA